MEARLQEARTELDDLGVALVDGEAGQVGFPTIVNNRRAFFSWRADDEGIDFTLKAAEHHLGMYVQQRVFPRDPTVAIR